MCKKLGQDDLLFRIDSLAPDATPITSSEQDEKDLTPDFHLSEGIAIEGFYFQPEFRSLITRDNEGNMKIFKPHPSGIVIPMTVVLAPVECALPGFLVLYAYRQMVRFKTNSGFSINGPAENLREDAFGRPFGDVISCIYPRLTFTEGRSINYQQERDNK